jgi:hypothetical protein
MTRENLRSVSSASIAFAAGISFATIVAAQSPLGAQDPVAPSLAPPAIPEAPVGHRQPRPSDLPPSVQREEQGNVPARGNAPVRGNADKEQSIFGQLPTICVRC